jgi:hypothetical protein
MTSDLSTLACQQVVELITELLGDSLAADDRVLLEQHLLVCPPCTAHLGQMRATIRLVGDLRADTAAAPTAPLLDVFRRLHKGRGP